METKDILKQLRLDAKLTQDELAERVYVTRQAVSRWETGETQPNTDTLKLLSKLYDVSINTLLGSPRQLVCQCAAECRSTTARSAVRSTAASTRTSASGAIPTANMCITTSASSSTILSGICRTKTGPPIRRAASLKTSCRSSNTGKKNPDAVKTASVSLSKKCFAVSYIWGRCLRVAVATRKKAPQTPHRENFNNWA